MKKLGLIFALFIGALFLCVGRASASSMSSNVTLVTVSSAGNTLTITGTGTSWVTGTTSFSILTTTGNNPGGSTLTGSALATGATSATLTLSAGSSAGTIAITDSLDSDILFINIVPTSPGLLSGTNWTTGTVGSSSAGVAGSTSGAGNATNGNPWTDINGSTAEVLSTAGLTILGSPSGGALNPVMRPASETTGVLTQEEISYFIVPSFSSSHVYAYDSLFRWTTGNTSYYYQLTFAGTTPTITPQKDIAGTATALIAAANFTTVPSVGDVLRVTAEVSGASPTTLGCTVYDMTTSTTLVSSAVTDSTSSGDLQTGGGQIGLAGYGSSGYGYPVFLQANTYGLATVPTPTFSPAAGSYGATQTVTISDAQAGSTIYYTTNGTTPTTSSTVYSGPITVSTTTTVEAIATYTGDTNSAVGSATYSITPVPTPTFSPGAGAYTSSQTVTISDTLGGTTIYYTTNGTTPTTSSSVYSSPISVSSAETIKALGVASGYVNSAIASASYTFYTPLPLTRRGWYDTRWAYRLPITVDSTNSIYNVTNGTIQLNLTPSNFTFSHAQSTGADIVVTGPDGLTPVPIYIANWTAGTSATVYAQYTLTAGQSRTLYLYYGNSSATSLSNFNATMAKPSMQSDTLALFHCDAGSGTTLADATSTYTGTLSAGASWGSDEAFTSGYSLTFNGTNGYVTVPSLLATYPTTGTLAVTCWMKPTATFNSSNATAQRLWAVTNDSNDMLDCYLTNGTGALNVRIEIGGTNYFLTSTTTTWTGGQWYFIAVKHTNTIGWQLFINGVQQGSTVVEGFPGNGTTEPFTIGAYNNTGTPSAFLAGSIDELQVTNGEFTQSRLAADYAHAAYDPNWEGAKWSKQGVILTASGGEGTAVQEPTVIYNSGTSAYVMWHEGGSEDMYRATSTDGIHWTDSSTTPILGGGHGGESNKVACNNIYFDGTTYWCYYCNQSPWTGAQQLATSTDGINWAKQSSPFAIPSGFNGLSNTFVVNTGSGYVLMYEGFIGPSPNFWWQMGSATGTSLSGPFTSVAGPITALEINGSTGEFGGPWIQKVGSIYEMWYHANTDTASLPTDIYRAYSTDLVNWTQYSPDGAYADSVMPRDSTDGIGNTSQTADPCIIQVGSTTYLYYTSYNNGAGTAQIRCATFAGSVQQLVTDGSPVTLGNEYVLTFSSMQTGRGRSGFRSSGR